MCVYKNVEKYVFDEREFNRIQIETEAKVNIIDSATSFKAKLTDLSPGGARLEMDKGVRLGEEFNISFQIRKKPFERVKSIAVWSDGEHAGHNHYGVRFLNMDKDSKEFLNTIT